MVVTGFACWIVTDKHSIVIFFILENHLVVDKGIEDILNTVPSDYEPTDEENVAVDEAMNKLQKALGVADEKFTAADEPDQQPAQEEQPQPDTEVATEIEPLVEADTVKSIGGDLPKEQAKPEEDA